jgi:biotin carboxyl carrier protein
METVVRAHREGTVKELLPALRSSVQAGDLLAVVSA